jgi:hypothetical protein
MAKSQQELIELFDNFVNGLVTKCSETEVKRLFKCLSKPDLLEVFKIKHNYSKRVEVLDEPEEVVTKSTRVCKAFYNGQVCPDLDGCLSEHPEVCKRPECKTRRSEDCTAWHPPICKSFKRLTHCMNGDACTARHPATCTTKDCSYQSGCALWHTKTPRTLVPRSRVPKVDANSGNSSGRTQARRSDSSRAKSGMKGKGTYVTRQLAENVRMREKIATLEQKQVLFCPQPKDFPPLPSYRPQQVLNSPPAPLHSFPWPPPAPTKGLVPPGPSPDVSALIAALLPLLQAFLPRSTF